MDVQSYGASNIGALSLNVTGVEKQPVEPDSFCRKEHDASDLVVTLNEIRNKFSLAELVHDRIKTSA